METSKAENPGLVIDPEVVECAAIAHDFGHPPFGHKGEEVLDNILEQLIEKKTNEAAQQAGATGADKLFIHEQMKQRYEHFEGNAHNFRLIMFLEKRENIDGLNLSDAVLLGVNKYPFPGTSLKKGMYLHEWAYISEIRKEWGIPAGKKTLIPADGPLRRYRLFCT